MLRPTSRCWRNARPRIRPRLRATSTASRHALPRLNQPPSSDWLRGNLCAFEGYQKGSTDAVMGKNWLVVDPLGHCQAAADQFHGDLIAGRVLRPILLSVELFNGTFAHGPIEGACVRACVYACVYAGLN